MNFYGCVPRIVSGRVTTFGLWRRPTSPSGNQSFRWRTVRQRLRVFHQLIGPFAKVQSWDEYKSDLRSNKHHLSSSENKARKSIGLYGI